MVDMMANIEEALKVIGRILIIFDPAILKGIGKPKIATLQEVKARGKTVQEILGNAVITA